MAVRIVQDDSGAPVASAEVRIEKARAGSVTVDAVTDGEGRFSAPGLAAGEYSTRPAVTIRLVRRVSRELAQGLASRMVDCCVLTSRALNDLTKLICHAQMLHLTRRASWRTLF
ncbi:MAG TPA: carboxypeptidase-like regulatory domain-containing protein [Bryobacteraceae bacterium]|nr:carboxypeptidase-like regulatory domain-containing protein [Bryobacteraceae bacterium]